ncbi:MAG: Flp pilus assembly protein CpaB [Bdellovibrionales bacterium RIFOXYD1_FULL_44_7]|nr:MAG: Flp pilus assembly protein CpaB [Bdellovibrionales bacterium RIFOXYD1_FULL_44_7]
MNNKALTLSLVMAVLAVFFVQSYVSSIEEEAKKKFGTEILVVKAKKDIKEQETLNDSLVELALIPKKFLEPASVFFEKREEDEETKKGVHSLSGMVAVVPIKKGEQITYNKLTDPGIRTGLAPQVTPGRRAVAVPVTEVSGVSKLVKPGDRVDLIAIIDGGGGKENKIAKTILQDVVVLAVGRNVTNNVARIVEADPFGGKERIRPLSEDTSFAAVTLEVEPAQAQSLALILANGDSSLTLSLRNNDDADRVNVGATTLSDVLGADAGRVQRVPTGRK